MNQAGAVQLLGRVGTQHPFSVAGIDEYYLQLSNTGAWSIVKNDYNGSLTTLASGTVTAPGTGTWSHLALTFNGSTISAAHQRHDRRHCHRQLVRTGPSRPGRQWLADR